MSYLIGENYHIYNRGAHKALIFHDVLDYERFLILLYISNDTRKPRVDLRRIKPREMFNYPRNTLTNIHAYCLMPNHFHIAVRETMTNGVSIFIHKLCTAYSMYYNKKYNHSGTIFQGQFKNKHIHNDDYLQYLIQYIHLNPYGIEEPTMNKDAKHEHLTEAISYSQTYIYSSFKDYLGLDRPQKNILKKLT